MSLTTVSPIKYLTDNAVLLAIRLDCIGKKRKINPSILDVDDAHILHIHKDILSCPELNSINLLDSQIRAFIRRHTYPTDFGSGVYILPLQMLEEVDEKLTDFQKERDILIEKFCENYDLRKEEAKERLGRFYNEDDYPDIEILTEKFDFKAQCLSFDVPKNIENVRSDIYEREKEKAEESWFKTFNMIKHSLRNELILILDHIIERMTPEDSGKKKKFKEATVNNLFEYLKNFHKKNIIQDVELETIVNTIKYFTKNVSIEDLRGDDFIRENMLSNFIKIRKKLTEVIESIEVRSITF